MFPVPAIFQREYQGIKALPGGPDQDSLPVFRAILPGQNQPPPFRLLVFRGRHIGGVVFQGIKAGIAACGRQGFLAGSGPRQP
jgi:hypothetical protein